MIRRSDRTTGKRPSEHPATPSPSVLELFLVFTRIALTSVGGSVSGWYYVEFVERRKWMTEDEFFNGLSISQALPGINIKNMAIWVGYRLRGRAGAIAAFVGIIVPPAFLIVLLATLFAALKEFEITKLILTGAAAAAIGLTLSMGIAAARTVPVRIVPAVLMAGTFVAVAIFELPLVWVVVVAGALGIAAAYADARSNE